MKKQLLFVLMLLMAVVAQAQQKIIITGVMYDPRGSDALVSGTESGGITHQGGFEYIQFLAAEAIDFEQTPYSVVTCVNPTAFGGAPTSGWATGSQVYVSGENAGTTVNRTYKFNLTSGTVAKGEYFYVGGPEKRIAGYWSSTYTTDISSAKWIRTIAYSSNGGDGGIGLATGGLMVNDGHPGGVAVFAGIAVTEASVPIDAVFYGSSTTMGATAITATYTAAEGSNPALGYRLPLNTDLHQATVAAPFLGMGAGTGPNRYVFLQQGAWTPTLTVDRGNFLSLGGVYDDVNNVWVTKRSASYTYITLANGTQTQYNLANIEATATKLSSVLPVVLTNFAAKNNANTVKLTWATAQEKNNAYFAVLRSTDGKTFVQIGTVGGNGNSQTAHNYSYVDNNPAAGTNYYQLKQVDNDGKSTLSNIEVASTGLAADALKAWSKNGMVGIIFNNTTSAKTAEITLSDIAGKKVASHKQEVSAGNNTLSFVAPLQPGLYVLTLQLGGTQAATKILVGK